MSDAKPETETEPVEGEVAEVEDEARTGEGEVATGEGEAPELDAEARERRGAALSQVLKFGDPALRSEASPVRDFDASLAEDVTRMVEIMRDGMGVGLAATQLGILRRLLVFQAGPDAPATALVNPEVEWTSAEEATAEEGCLSLPGIVVEVERPLHARVKGASERGEPIVIEASGLEARVIQHEIDHLDGVLIVDRTTKEQRRGAMRALREGDTYAPPSAERDADDGRSSDEDNGARGAGSTPGASTSAGSALGEGA